MTPPAGLPTQWGSRKNGCTKIPRGEQGPRWLIVYLYFPSANLVAKSNNRHETSKSLKIYIFSEFNRKSVKNRVFLVQLYEMMTFSLYYKQLYTHTRTVVDGANWGRFAPNPIYFKGGNNGYFVIAQRHFNTLSM